MNALIQGSAARHTKLWMRACRREGIVPLLQMHDALECSVATREQGELVARLGCEAVRLEVPIRVDLKYGESWGDAKHEWKEVGHTSSCTAPAVAEAELTTRKINGDVHPIEDRAEIELGSAEKPLPPLAAIIGQPLKERKICCPLHDDRKPSCHIYDDHFYCFGCGARGNAVDWLTLIEGFERDAAIELLANWRGPTLQPQSDDDADMLPNALRLWEQAQPIAGTLAEHYLANARRIDIDKLPDKSSRVLRFHPMCIFGLGTKVPCLLALFRDAQTDAPAGIHRIALTPEVLAGGKVQRRMLGRWPAARAIKLWPAESSLVIGEGIETVLAAATRLPHRGALLRPAWAIGSSKGVARFPLIAGIKQLIILVDNDANGVGRSCAEECATRWAAAGRAVALLTPRQAGTDFNDIVRSDACLEANTH
jgi:hypothetical protein